MVQKISGIALLLVTLFIALPLGAAASTLSLHGWQTDGSQMWRITFPGYAGGLSNTQSQSIHDGASELVYPQSGSFVTARYEQPLSSKRTLSVEGGLMAAIEPATGTDSDWDYSRQSNLWYYGEFLTNGSSTFFNIDVKQPLFQDFELFYGYGYSNSNYKMTDGMYYIMNYQNEVNDFPNLNSAYRIVYHGPHAGIAATKLISPQVALVGSVSYAPLAMVQGRGWWNLRQLDFKHLGTGQMIDSSIGLRYNVGGRQDNSLTLGYRYQYYGLYTGSENTSADITWSEATKVQQGIYFGGDFKF